MPWFAAHAVMYFQHTDGPQERYLVWENVLLIEASDSKEAFARAEERARQDEDRGQGGTTVDDRPAHVLFGGIRKMITVCHESADNQLRSGDEITYSEFEVADKDTLQRLIRGEETEVVYVE